MANRDEIIKYANEYLGIYAYEDYGPQGAQFLGNEEVDYIASAVSANLEAISSAKRNGAQMLITHHGLFWNTEPRTFDVRMQQRLSFLEETQLTVLGYHLCLDAHPEIGNNIMTLKGLGATNLTPFGEIGWGGEIKCDSVNSFVSRLAKHYRSVLLHTYVNTGKKPERVAVVTGGGANYIHQAAKEGYDLLLTGEPAEPSKALAKELGISFIAAGHHVTEKIGIQALGNKLAKEFEIKHNFVNVTNYV